MLQPVPIADEAIAVPASLARKVERLREAPVEDLVAAGIVPSSEVLARVAPPDHGTRGRAVDVRRPALRDLYASHLRRVPPAPLAPAAEPGAPGADRGAAVGPGAGAVRVSLSPDTRAPPRHPAGRHAPTHGVPADDRAQPDSCASSPRLARQADLDLPFVEEVAADIFMGTFTLKWQDAAAIAADGSWPARSTPGTTALPDVGPGRPRSRSQRAGGSTGAGARSHAPRSSPTCAPSAPAKRSSGTEAGSPATAPSSSRARSSRRTTSPRSSTALELTERLAGPPSWRRANFQWIVREQTPVRPRQAELQMVKNTAYAWRQAIFFLSLAPTTDQVEAVARPARPRRRTPGRLAAPLRAGSRRPGVRRWAAPAPSAPPAGVTVPAGSSAGRWARTGSWPATAPA